MLFPHPTAALDTEAIRKQIDVLIEEAQRIWTDGGWAMVAIAAIALVMFSVGMNVWLRLRQKGFQSVPEKTWRSWLDDPSARKGPIGRLLERATGGDSLKQISVNFDELRASEVAPFERDLCVMKVCVGATPLLGLLGTVTGMLATFGALSAGRGGEKTMEMIAAGISEALITTETGLLIALAGLFFQYMLSRKHERYKAFLAHLETVCTQNLYRKLQGARRKAA